MLKVRLRKPRQVKCVPPGQSCVLGAKVQGSRRLGEQQRTQRHMGHVPEHTAQGHTKNPGKPCFVGDLGQILSHPKASVSLQAEKGDKRNLAGLF